MANAEIDTEVKRVRLELDAVEAEELAAIVSFVSSVTPGLNAVKDELRRAFPDVRSRWALKNCDRYVEPKLVRYPEQADDR